MPMAWRPSGEIRLMRWTGKKHQRARLRRRPQIELLDDRCLLSAGGALKPFEHVARPALERRHALVVHHRHHAAPRAEKAENQAAATTAAAPTAAAPTAIAERPAGTIETGAATAYDPITGAAAARSAYNVDGAGMTVAVIDTGVDYNNPALGGGFGPGNKVIAGYDFADGTANPMAAYSQHGTSVAGLIASSDPNDLGVAPGADIVALRVTDSSNTASLSSVASALQWVVTNHSTYNITAVNMSLSDGGNYVQNWFANDGGDGQQITQLIGQLTALNIPVIVATGNSFSGSQGEGFAAIVAGTISVTATDLSGNLLSDAQRLGSALGGASATTIAAPGEGLTAPSGDSGTATDDGTSFAAALVTGGVTLLQDIYQSRFGSLPTVAQIKSWLQGGSTPINDPVTGITLGELSIPNSASLIPAPAPPPPPAPPPAPPASTTTSSMTPATDSVQIYVNGHQVNLPASDSSTALDESEFAQLILALTSSQASGSGSSVFSGTQVQIWNA
jgi:subtilisin family serine protease